MSKSIKYILGYGLTFLVAMLLLWWVYKDMSIGDMFDKIFTVKYHWILLSYLFALLAHYIRAYRWNLMLSSLGYRVPTFRVFMAVMSGYFANFLIPRIGEITRCVTLKRAKNVPTSVGLGSVVSERIIDVLCLLVLFVITIFLQFDKLGDFVMDVVKGEAESYNQKISSLIVLLIILIGAFIVITIAIIIFRKRLFQIKQLKRFLNMSKNFRDGLLAIKNTKQQKEFWFSSVLIWVFYFFSSFVVFFSMPETEHLGYMAGLAVLVTGGISISIPVQGGIGAYHLLVSNVLLLYNIAPNTSKIFTFLTHTSQALMIFFVGGLFLIINLLMTEKNIKLPKIKFNK